MKMNVRVGQQGKITLPKNLRDAYAIKSGDRLELTDLGEGKFLLSRLPSQIDKLLDSLRTVLEADGETLESMLKRLRTKRKKSCIEPSI